ncbi:MAG: TatD family hydrolase [Candidatus Zixiibacteriota bacterium]
MIDSHCHIDFKDFKGKTNEIVRAAQAAGVHTLVNIGADLHTSKNSVALADKYDSVYATIGIHPHDAKTYNQDVENELLKLAENKKVKAIGEIGLDYYRDLSPRKLQQQVFRRQIEIAIDLKLPIVIHTRESFADTLSIVKEFDGKIRGGVFHCFPGNIDEAYQVIDLGFYISVGGVITFPKAGMANVAAEAPLSSILLETDSPYLTPVPFRGKTNQPAYVKYVCEKLAELRGMSFAEVEKITDRNSQKMYRLVDIIGG